MMGPLGAAIAKAHDGEVLALHVVRVPVQLSISDGRMFLREGKPIMEEAISQAREVDVPVHTMIRLDRHIGRAILDTARKRRVELMLLGWPGHTCQPTPGLWQRHRLIAKNPPCDLAVVRFRERREPKRILVPTAGGANTRRAIGLAIDQARQLLSRRANRRWSPCCMSAFRPMLAPKSGPGDSSCCATWPRATTTPEGQGHAGRRRGRWHRRGVSTARPGRHRRNSRTPVRPGTFWHNPRTGRPPRAGDGDDGQALQGAGAALDPAHLLLAPGPGGAAAHQIIDREQQRNGHPLLDSGGAASNAVSTVDLPIRAGYARIAAMLAEIER